MIKYVLKSLSYLARIYFVKKPREKSYVMQVLTTILKLWIGPLCDCQILQRHINKNHEQGKTLGKS